MQTRQTDTSCHECAKREQVRAPRKQFCFSAFAGKGFCFNPAQDPAQDPSQAQDSSQSCGPALVDHPRKQAVAQAGNHTCVELSSARSTRTRFGPLSAAMSTSSSSRRSCRGAIVGLHALAEFCFSSHSPQIPLPTNPFGEVSWGGMPQTLLS
eukprot:scaffold7970_cov125-Isochrysis_galbana.AAC.3